MIIFEILRSAIHALVAKRLRTMLTMLGIIVGVGSVIVMLAYGEGQKRELLKRFEGISDRSMYVGFYTWSRGENLMAPRSVKLKAADAMALSIECSAVEFAIPELNARTEVSREANSLTSWVSVAGPEIFSIYDAGIEFGRLYTDDDNLDRATVCVVGSGVQEELFPEISAVDQYLTVFDRRFRIIGVLRRFGNQSRDTAVYIPWLTGSERIPGLPGPSNFRAQAVSTRHVALAQRQVREQLHILYPALPVPEDIYDEDLSPIRIRSVASWKEEREATADSFSLLLKVIGALSLLIGGVGVMNIMLVSVHERTPEIGLRKAIGARRRDILAQFLAESVMICLAGGALGMFGAFIVCRYLERLPAEANMPDPVITSWAVLVAVAVTLGTGLFFGVYPAAQAAKLNPIEALHEGR